MKINLYLLKKPSRFTCLQRVLKALGILLLCTGIPVASIAQTQYADTVIAYSSQYSTPNWAALQATGAPNVASCGDNADAWASATQDGQREYLVLGFATAQVVSTIKIWETYNPGAIDTIYLRNSSTGIFTSVYTHTAAATSCVIGTPLTINITTTAYTVDQIRIAVNSPAVAGWNEIDAVQISSITCTDPTIQATIGVYTNNTTGNSLTANWTRGNGTAGVIVTGRLTATTSINPLSVSTYTANAAFGSGTGSQITGAGNYVVYVGTGTSVNITGLTFGVNYTFAVYEYDSTGPCYLTPGSSNAVTACTGGTSYTVTSAASGTTSDGVSLRWAITQSNADCSKDTIKFNIAGTPPFTIMLSSALPSLTNSAGVIIDGSTQPDNGFDGVSPKIILDGTNLSGAVGLDIEGQYSELYGLYLRKFGNAVNVGSGINSNGSNFIIGAPGKGNVMNTDNSSGIVISSGVNGGVVQGNKIGTDTTGTVAESSGYGIDLYGTNIQVGGTNPGEANLVSGNSYNIYIEGSYNLLEGNILGPDINGNYLGASFDGIYIFTGGGHNTIGGSAPGAGNIMAYNVAISSTGGGIEIESSANNLISRNSIYCNGDWGGIELIGGNNSYPSPVILSATGTSATGTAQPKAIVELFYNHSGCTPTPTLYCQGKTYIGTSIADSSGNWTFAGSLTAGMSLVATATDSVNNTSQFSDCSVIVTGGSPPVASFQSSNTSFCADNCINFTDLSTDASTWQWSFPGGVPASSTSQNPQHICYTGNGTYNVTLVASNFAGSDTLMITNLITVFPAPPAPVITQSATGDTLFCSFDPTYTTYQWYADTTLIPGATNAFYVAANTGNYNVEVSNESGCSIAGGISVVITGLQSFSSASDALFTISPNPANDELNITGNRQTQNTVLTIYNLVGEKMLEEKVKSTNYITVNVKALSSGIYFLLLANENNSWIGKFVKQ